MANVASYSSGCIISTCSAGYSLQSGACAEARFADTTALVTAVQNCVSAVPSGLDCCKPTGQGGGGADCGVGGEAVIGAWDVSSVTSVENLFLNAASFNQPIGDWNTSLVTNMNSVFLNAASFNQPIGAWDVSSVTSVRNLFSGATSFNQPLADWDVSKITSTYLMFNNAAAFDQPLSNWDVSSVTSMEGMFHGASAFNSDISGWGDKLVGPPSFYLMFANAASFNQDLRSTWDVSRITNTYLMFNGDSAMEDANKPCTTPATSAHPLYWVACL